MDINKYTLDSIQRYYKVLENTGYVEDGTVYKLIVLTFISDLFGEDFGEYITDNHLMTLQSIVDCISNSSCITSYNRVALHTEPIKNYLEDTPVRIDEEEIIRISHDDLLRIANL